jgi:hypothetical protein
MADSFWFEVSVLLVGVFLAHYGGGCFITNLGCFFLDLFLFKTLCCDLGFSDLACCNLGLFGSKGPFMPAVFCHRGLWYVNSSVLAVGSFAVSYLSKCSLNTFFFAIWFRARARVRRIVSVEFVLTLVFFHLLRLAPKTTCS